MFTERGFDATTIEQIAAAACVSELAACRAACDRWAARAGSELAVYLDAALTALPAGFAAGEIEVGAPSAD